jgi:acyl-CoA hydrolase
MVKSTAKKAPPLHLKTVAESTVHSRKLVMPDQINADGRLFGGCVMGWIDKVAAMSAQLHAECEVVTARIDNLTFVAPIMLGDHVILHSMVTYVGRTSMEIVVDVWKENPIKREKLPATKAYLTFVAIDSTGKPKAIPGLKFRSDEERAQGEAAKARVQKRLAERNA